MIELFIEKRPVDINEAFSTLLTLAIDDVKDFGAKNTTFSKTIVLPGTKNNNRLFGNVFNLAGANNYNPGGANIAANYNPAIGASALMFADNMQIFKGVIRLLEVTVDDGFIEYEVAVFGELGGFVAKLGNLKLEDLDFSAYDTVYSVANIVSSWDNTPGTGLFFPLIDYGTYSVNKHDWDYHAFRPALYVREYIAKIFAASGYAFDCDLFNTDRFKRLVNPHNTKSLDRVSATGLDVSYSGAGQTLVNPATGLKIQMPTYVAIGAFTTPDSRTFTFAGTTTIIGTFTARIQGTYEFSINDPGNPYNLRLTLLGSGFTDQHYYFADTSGPTAFDVTLSIVAPINTGDILEVIVAASNDFGDTWDVTVTDCHLTFIMSSRGPVPIGLGEDIIINDTLPKNILQREYLSSIVKLFNLYIFEDYENEKTLYIQPFIDYYIDADAVDWTDKVDRSRPLKVKPMGELNARYYEFAFKSDSDFYNDLYEKRYSKAYGTNVYDSGFEFVEDKKTVSVIFAGTPLVGYAGEDKVYSTIFKRTGNTTVVEENVDSVLRILQTKKLTGLTSWALKNGATTLNNYNIVGYAGHLDDPDVPTNDIQFGVPEELFFTLLTGALNVNQFNVYWSSYMAEITDKDSKILKCTLRLYAKDIYQFDFSRLIYIDGSLYRVNKITDFNATKEDTCEGEFLKVINRIY